MRKVVIHELLRHVNAGVSNATLMERVETNP